MHAFRDCYWQMLLQQVNKWYSLLEFGQKTNEIIP